MIQFEKIISVTNQQFITDENWRRIYAKSLEPSKGLRGLPEIEKEIYEHGGYWCKWRLVLEPEGYIFREVFADTGINGHHPTPQEAVFHAIKPNKIIVYLDIPY